MSMLLPSPAGAPTGSPTGTRRDRRHGHLLDDHDRRVLERAGWRTFLTYRENHVRAWDGTLLSVTPVWIAEAERADRAASARAGAVQATGATPTEAWAHLRRRAAEAVRDAERRAARQRLMRQQRARDRAA